MRTDEEWLSQLSHHNELAYMCIRILHHYNYTLALFPNHSLDSLLGSGKKIWN